MSDKDARPMAAAKEGGYAGRGSQAAERCEMCSAGHECQRERADAPPRAPPRGRRHVAHDEQPAHVQVGPLLRCFR